MYGPTKQATPIHRLFIYLFIFTVFQVACYLKDRGLTSLLTCVPLKKRLVA